MENQHATDLIKFDKALKSSGIGNGSGSQLVTNNN